MIVRKLQVVSQESQKEEESTLTATIALFRNTENGIEVLIGQREKPPMANGWSLPGGHVEVNETATDGGIRELFEETGVKVKCLIQVKITNSPHRRGVKNVVFTAVVNPSVEIICNSDLKNATWIKLEELPELVFDNNQYVMDSLNKLSGTRSGI